jgi:hypothetical protein
MKLRDVSISKGMTVNLGGHQFHKVEIGMTAVFDDDDDFESGVNKLTALVNSKLAAEINATIDNAAQSKKKILMEEKKADHE